MEEDSIIKKESQSADENLPIDKQKTTNSNQNDFEDFSVIP